MHIIDFETHFQLRLLYPIHIELKTMDNILLTLVEHRTFVGRFRMVNICLLQQ